MKIKYIISLWLVAALGSGMAWAAGEGPKTMAGSYLSGQFAKSNGDIDDSIGYLERVYRENPDNADIAGQLQGMLVLQGRIGEAMALAEKPGKPDAHDPLADLLLTLREIKNNHPDQAAALLSTTAENGSAQLWQPLFTAWLEVSNHKLAKPLTVESLSVDIGHAVPLVNYHLALINAQAGFIEASANNFKAAVPDPKNPPPRVMQMLLRFYEQNGQLGVLKPTVDSWHASHPEGADGEAPPVIVTAQDGIAEVLFSMGGIMLGAGVTNDAAIYLQLALYIKPDFAEAALALGDAYGDLRQYARSEEAYARIPAGNPLWAKAQLHIAVSRERTGKLKEALGLLDKIAKQSPGDTDALITKGDLLRIHERYGEATVAYSQGLQRFPELGSNQWPVLFARGACYEREGKWDLAQKDLRQALELKPGQPDVLNYLGYGLLEHGEKTEEAREMIETAVKQRPDDAQIVDSMGWVLYLAGDYAGAAEYLEKAVELLPGDATVNDHLGDAYWRLGRKNEARFQWERSLTFSPEAKLAGSLHKKLKEGLPPSTLAHAAPAIPSARADQAPVNTATP